MKITVFGASTSKNSINKQFAIFAANQFNNSEIEILDLNDFTVPLYSVDFETENGVPDNAIRFYNKLQSNDLIIISLAEHNGTYTAAFKNLFDWVSRHQSKMFENKKLILLSTSPGQRGGMNVLEAALKRFPFHGADIIFNFSLPKFYENFDAEKGIIDKELNDNFNHLFTKIEFRKSS